MKRFNVLDPNLSVDQSYFLEASAGTGKTFSIEHLVRRYLLELQPRVTIDQILVVTFTRSATRELKGRIYRTLERGQESAPQDRRGALSDALLRFDDAQVFTIHGFCMQMLQLFGREAGLHIGSEPLLTHEDKERLVRDFFRSGLTAERYSSAQIRQVLRLTQGNHERLISLIVREMDRGLPVDPGPTYGASLRQFVERLPPMSGSAALAAFERLVGSLVGVADRSGRLKPFARAAMEAFARMLDSACPLPSDFDQLIEHGLPCLAPLKARARITHPFPEELGPILQKAREPLAIFARLVADCQGMLRKRSALSDAMTHGGLLETMHAALQRDSFRKAVQARYAAVIVDEFQDTDPLQWQIFQTAFHGSGHRLVLVGDPKQSIYAFRNADVYCYLEARRALGPDRCYSLCVNYRSRPGLLRALNGLFAERSAPGLFRLPRDQAQITCEEVEAGVKEDNALSREGAVRFLQTSHEGLAACETSQLFPYIISEIVTLRERLHLPFSHFAILVRDRFQGERVKRALKEWSIPAASARGKPLSETQSLAELRTLVRAGLMPRSERHLRRALATRLMGGSFDQLRHLEPSAFAQIFQLHEALMTGGFAQFFETLLRGGPAERLLREEGGDGYLQELFQVASYLIDWQVESGLCVEQLLAHLDRLAFSSEEIREVEEDGVQVLTAFASKGLEFGVVFALGLAGRYGRKAVQLIREGGTLAAQSAHPELKREEEAAEKIRLLYVAMTRARDRVYVPVIPSRGESPVELLLERLTASPEEIEGVQRIDLETVKSSPRRPALPEVPALTEPQGLPSLPMGRALHSFTSLSKELEHEGVALEEAAIPAGRETGIVIHKILEEVSFRGEITCEIVRPYVHGTALEPFAEPIAEMLSQALRVDLGRGFCLADLDESQMHRELEFLYPEGDLFTGAIDLVFQEGRQVYVLDWKTNQLPAYDPHSLKETMERRGYHLQAKLYREAVTRYLRCFNGEFGGVFYLFLRGPGVYFDA